MNGFITVGRIHLVGLFITAFDIAGQDRADPEDMKTAMRLAVEMARQKTLGQPVN